MQYDIAVVGGGVVGAMILRTLTKSQLAVCMLEKENDVAMGQSKANSGIVHAGFDALPGTLKARFNVRGNEMMPAVAKELGVKYQNNGSLVVAFSAEELETLQELKARGEQNGVKGLSVISREQLFFEEPNVSKSAVGALKAATGGIICPYELTIAAVGNAMDNGAQLFTDFAVCKIEGDFGDYTVTAQSGQTVRCKAIINCAGLASQYIASLIGDNSFTVGGRKGEYLLLDRESGGLVKSTIFCTPTKAGKGILVSPTVDGNVILGPTAEDGCVETTTSAEGLSAVTKKARAMCDGVPFYNVITSFAGVRAYCDRHDFIIEPSKTRRGFINCAGIESPGLTAAPAIAEYVVNSLIAPLFELKPNPTFNGERRPDYYFKTLSTKEKNEVIKKDPSYGHIVCRCEQVSEGEIRHAVRANPPAKNIDAVKRRVRAGMGRCQGGFCQPYVAEIIAEELGIQMEQVTKHGKGSTLLVGKTK